MVQDHDHINLAKRPSPPPTLHQAREQSKATWTRDLQGLHEHAKERFADVKWLDSVNGDSEGVDEAEYLRDGDGLIGMEVVDQLLKEEPSSEDTFVKETDAVFAHKAIVYARAPKAFKERFFPVLLLGGLSSPNLASVAPRSSLSSASIPNLSRHGLGTDRSASRNYSSLQRPSSRARRISLSHSTSELSSDHAESIGRLTASANDTSSTFTRPPTASSHPADDHFASPHVMDNDGRLTLSHQGMPEMLKQGLQWLYTAEGSFNGLRAEGLGFSHSELSSATLSREILGEDVIQTTGLISAKAVDGKNPVHDKKLTISRMRLAQDLTYMWRSRLYTDVKIRIASPVNGSAAVHVNGKTNKPLPLPPFAFNSAGRSIHRPASASTQLDDQRPSATESANHEFDIDQAGQIEQGTVFSAHRFVLCSRSPYFHQVLLNSGAFQSHPAAGSQSGAIDPSFIPEITLPSPPFTPMATYFILGYLYSGSLAFSNHTPDLPTAFSIMKSAMFLEIDTLVTELEALIREDLCHGMTFPLTHRGKKVGGCACKKCSKRIPKVLRFAVAPEVQAGSLREDAMRYLVQGGWAECWNKDLANLDEHVQDDLVNRISQQVSAQQIPTLYRKVSDAQKHITMEKGDWVDILQDMLETIRQSIRQTLLQNFREVVQAPDFISLLTDEGMESSLRDIILQDLADTANKADFCQFAPGIYQAITSEILQAKVGPQHLPLLPIGSNSREAVEETRTKVLAVIKRRWLQMRPVGAFDDIEDWALREISEALEVPQKELLRPKSPPAPKAPLPTKPITVARQLSAMTDRPRPATRPALSSSSSRSSLQTSGTSTSVPRNAARSSIPRPPSQVSLAPPIRRPASQMSLGISSQRDPSPTSTPSVPTIPGRTTAAASTNSVSVRQRVASYAAPSTARGSPAIQTSTPRTSSRLANPVSRGQTSQSVENGAEARARTNPRTVDSGSLPVRLRPTTSASPSGVSHTVASRQRSVLPLNKAPSASSPSLTNRKGSVRSMRQAIELGPATEVKEVTPQTVVRTPMSAVRPSCITTGDPVLRNSASAASLRAKPLQASTESATRGRVTTKVTPAVRKVGVAGLSSSTLVPSSAKTNNLTSVNRNSVTSTVSKSVSKKAGLTSGPSPMVNPVKAAGLNDEVTKSDRKSPPSAARTHDTNVNAETEAAMEVPNIAETSLEAQDPAIPASSSTESENGLAGNTPPLALRPLKLVEKRHSLTPGQSITIGSNKVPTTSPQVKDGAQEVKKARSPSSAPLVISDLVPGIGNGPTDSRAQRASPIGLGLGLPLNPPSSRPAGTPIASPVLSADSGIKYHPATAFDPPTRLPSISVTDSKEEEEEDDCIPYDKSKGVSLRIGIPCVIYVAPPSTLDSATSTPVRPRARLKAACRYIGQVDGQSGEWLGVEINMESLRRVMGVSNQDPEEPLLPNGQHDGSWNGVRYYKIDKTSSLSSITSPAFSRPTSPLTAHQRTSRDVSGRQAFLGGPPSSFNAGSLSPRIHSLANTRRGSPSREFGWDGTMSFMSNPETSWASGGSDKGSERKCGLWVKPSEVVFVPGAHEL